MAPSFHFVPEVSVGKRKWRPTVFAGRQQLREVKRARAAGYNAPLNAGYPRRRALACERGAARAPPWITAVFCRIPLETIPFSRMLRRELQAENDSFKSSFSA
jgi:hypothetical protein